MVAVLMIALLGAVAIMAAAYGAREGRRDRWRR